MGIQRLQVFGCEHKEGTAKKTGQAYSMDTAQCALLDAAGVVKQVGELTLPKGHEAVKPGVYDVTTELARSMDGKIVSRIVTLEPARPAPPMPPKA